MTVDQGKVYEWNGPHSPAEVQRRRVAEQLARACERELERMAAAGWDPRVFRWEERCDVDGNRFVWTGRLVYVGMLHVESTCAPSVDGTAKPE